MTAFRIFVCLFALVPLFFGVTGVLGGASALVPEPEIYTLPEIDGLDSQFRYLSGVYIGIAAMLFYVAGDVRGRAMLFRAIVLAVFIGGVGRAVSWMMVGQPPQQFAVGMVIELLVPLSLLWLNRVIAR